MSCKSYSILSTHLRQWVYQKIKENQTVMVKNSSVLGKLRAALRLYTENNVSNQKQQWYIISLIQSNKFEFREDNERGNCIYFKQCGPNNYHDYVFHLSFFILSLQGEAVLLAIRHGSKSSTPHCTEISNSLYYFDI